MQKLNFRLCKLISKYFDILNWLIGFVYALHATHNQLEYGKYLTTIVITLN